MFFKKKSQQPITEPRPICNVDANLPECNKIARLRELQAILDTFSTENLQNDFNAHVGNLFGGISYTRYSLYPGENNGLIDPLIDCVSRRYLIDSDQLEKIINELESLKETCVKLESKEDAQKSINLEIAQLKSELGIK